MEPNFSKPNFENFRPTNTGNEIPKQEIGSLDNSEKIVNLEADKTDRITEQELSSANEELILPEPVMPTVPVKQNAVISNDDNSKAGTDHNNNTPLETWYIEQAKNILEKTKDDPHTRQDSVRELGKKYVIARYGSDLTSDKQVI